MVVYWTVAIIFNKLNAINNILLLIIIIILLINSNNYHTQQAYHVFIFIILHPYQSSIIIMRKSFLLLPKQKVIPVPHQDSNETFQAITAAQRGREAADPLAKFLSDPTQVYLGDQDEMRS